MQQNVTKVGGLVFWLTHRYFERKKISRYVYKYKVNWPEIRLQNKYLMIDGWNRQHLPVNICFDSWQSRYLSASYFLQVILVNLLFFIWGQVTSQDFLFLVTSCYWLPLIYSDQKCNLLDRSYKAFLIPSIIFDIFVKTTIYPNIFHGILKIFNFAGSSNKNVCFLTKKKNIMLSSNPDSISSRSSRSRM